MVFYCMLIRSLDNVLYIVLLLIMHIVLIKPVYCNALILGMHLIKIVHVNKLVMEIIQQMIQQIDVYKYVHKYLIIIV